MHLSKHPRQNGRRAGEPRPIKRPALASSQAAQASAQASRKPRPDCEPDTSDPRGLRGGEPGAQHGARPINQRTGRAPPDFSKVGQHADQPRPAWRKLARDLDSVTIAQLAPYVHGAAGGGLGGAGALAGSPADR